MSCSCTSNPCSCSPCQPANTVYQGTCTDPGTSTSLRHVLGLDSQFCNTRLLPGDGGYLVARATGSGGWLINFTTEPVVALSNITAAQSTVFGQFIVQGSDNIMRTLTGPAIANLYPRTNAAGQITFEVLPNATVPDPLTVGVANVITTLNAADVNITGTLIATGLATNTLVNILGIDANNHVIKGTLAVTGSQCASWFESAISPSIWPFPNQDTNSGVNLIIGNCLFDSSTAGGTTPTLFTADNVQTIRCQVAGTYVIDFGAQVLKNNDTPNDNMKAGITLTINGTAVNTGNNTNNWGNVHNKNVWGQEMRRLAQNDLIRLTLTSDNQHNIVQQARVNFTRLGA